ncbi:MAG TPA: ABC transporter transmembrane domain-containing protein [Anaerolineales bacterium]|nr:ABC transporter transmembrane domain-containing protein [Anaerolineales bacterium]
MTNSKEKLNRPTINEIRRLFGYLRPYRARMALAILALILGSALGLLFPWIMQNLVDSVLTQGNLAELDRIAILLLGAFLLRSVFYYFQGISLSFVGERIVADLRSELYQQLHRLSLRFYTERRVGELISRLASDVTLVRSALTNNIATVLSQALMFAGSLVLMLVLNWRLTLFILFLAPMVAASAAIFGARLRRLSTEIQDQLADSSALAEEALNGIRVVKAFEREPFEIKRYVEQVERTFRAAMSMATIRSAFGPLISFMAFGSLAGILWFGGREVLAGRITAGALIAFLVYGANIGASVGSFTNLYTQLQEAAGASRRIFELLDEEPDIDDSPESRPISNVEGRIRFSNVSFAYEKIAGHVLCHINLEIKPGEVLALVGPSGAGKSTLFNLIPRFYDPSEGQVQLDGQDLRSINLASLRSQIGLVPQETQLFSGSVRENLRYGRLEATDAEIEDAARAANAEEFIIRLPQGYDTQVGERGVKLSGGQRQRIAIARALLKNPRILLLDEATSSLDSESEGLVQEALERLMKNRTTIIIAHRLSTVQNAHRIAVLDQGELVELGSHEQLINLGGLYSRLYRLQFEMNTLAI